jgi:hypothetical protein
VQLNDKEKTQPGVQDPSICRATTASVLHHLFLPQTRAASLQAPLIPFPRIARPCPGPPLAEAREEALTIAKQLAACKADRHRLEAASDKLAHRLEAAELVRSDAEAAAEQLRQRLERLVHASGAWGAERAALAAEAGELRSQAEELTRQREELLDALEGESKARAAAEAALASSEAARGGGEARERERLARRARRLEERADAERARAGEAERELAEERGARASEAAERRAREEVGSAGPRGAIARTGGLEASRRVSACAQLPFHLRGMQLWSLHDAPPSKNATTNQALEAELSEARARERGLQETVAVLTARSEALGAQASSAGGAVAKLASLEEQVG